MVYCSPVQNDKRFPFSSLILISTNQMTQNFNRICLSELYKENMSMTCQIAWGNILCGKTWKTKTRSFYRFALDCMYISACKYLVSSSTYVCTYVCPTFVKNKHHNCLINVFFLYDLSFILNNIYLFFLRAVHRNLKTSTGVIQARPFKKKHSHLTSFLHRK